MYQFTFIIALLQTTAKCPAWIGSSQGNTLQRNQKEAISGSYHVSQWNKFPSTEDEGFKLYKISTKLLLPHHNNASNKYKISLCIWEKIVLPYLIVFNTE